MFRSRSPAIGKGRSNRRSPVKRQRRLNGVDEIVLSLYAKGLTTGEISAHFAEIFPRKREGPPGASVSKETISRITDKVQAEMQDWAARPLDEVYAAIFVDAIVVKVRRRSGRKPADLPPQAGGTPSRDRRQPRRTPRRARIVGRHRR